jgi:hypothetical protein
MLDAFNRGGADMFVRFLDPEVEWITTGLGGEGARAEHWTSVAAARLDDTAPAELRPAVESGLGPRPARKLRLERVPGF